MFRLLLLTFSFLAPLTLLLNACASRTTSSGAGQFDLGPLPAAPASAPTRAGKSLKVAEITVPAMLDGTMMFYRLSYAELQQPRPYANHRWSMPPGQMLAQRVKSQLAQHGLQVMAANDTVNTNGILKIELEEFMQNFPQPQQSQAQLRWRATLVQGKVLIAQRTFQQQVPAVSADAPGGAQALARASDLAIAELLQWLGSLPTLQ